MRARLIAIAVSTLLAGGAMAQPADNNKEPPVPPTFAEPPSVTAMEEPQQGDYWSYEVRDEITGKLVGPRITTITEVTPTEISVRLSSPSGGELGLSVYDRSWNLKSGAPWKFTPHDGQGIKSPLRVGATWALRAEGVESEHGIVWVRNGSSKVMGQEKAITKAGIFDTFLIEATYTLRRSTDNGGNVNQIVSRTWYAPAIDHWVRRTLVARTDGHLRSNTTTELVAYGRRE
jgi:hypothetical protein